jgi:hypothetical protein
MNEWMSAHTYELLKQYLVWRHSFFLRFIPIFSFTKSTFQPSSLYPRQAFLQVFLQYPLYVTNDKNWQRCTSHDMASMDDESDSPRTPKNRSSPHSTAAERWYHRRGHAERKEGRDEAVTSYETVGSQAGEAKCQLSERVRRQTRHIYQLAYITHTQYYRYNTTHHLALNHSCQKRATTLQLTFKPFF